MSEKHQRTRKGLKYMGVAAAIVAVHISLAESALGVEVLVQFVGHLFNPIIEAAKAAWKIVVGLVAGYHGVMSQGDMKQKLIHGAGAAIGGWGLMTALEAVFLKIIAVA